MRETASPRPHVVVSLVAVALAGVLGVAVWTWQGLLTRQGGEGERPLEGLQVFWPVPDFSLTERSGRRVTLADLRGKVWIANFIYTHCTDSCPLQSAAMARLQADLASEPDAGLVSITVDPEQDTPEVLAKYASRFGADRDRWLFLTGERKAIYTLAQEGFRLSAVDPSDATKSPPEKSSPAGGPDTRQRQSALSRLTPVHTVGRVFSDGVIWLLKPSPAMAHPGHPGKPFMHSSLFALVDRQARIRGYYHSDEEAALGRLRQDVKALLRENRP